MSNCKFCGQPLENHWDRFCGSRSCYLTAVREKQKEVEDLYEFGRTVQDDYYQPRFSK